MKTIKKNKKTLLIQTYIKLSDSVWGQQLGDLNSICYITFINVSCRYKASNNRLSPIKKHKATHVFHPLTLSNAILPNHLITHHHAMFMLNWRQRFNSVIVFI